MSDIADRDVDKFVLATLDKGGEAVMVSANIDELPVIIPTHFFQVVDVFGLKGFIIFAGVAPRRKFVIQIFFEFC